MSLNRALTELFKAIREEAAQNPAFAEKLDDALGHYKPPKRKRRTARPAPVQPAMNEAAALKPPPAFNLAAEIEAKAEAAEGLPAAPAINPIAFLSREGEQALREELSNEAYSDEALAALVAEHNLDPAGLADGADKPGLIDQIVAQAKKRVERDKALFDY